ncbi:MAG: SOS response-associated peptidase [Ignavibacteria bacterium]|nr:SOS response-associated peptidase [Ignavibacteria bacterium]
MCGRFQLSVKGKHISERFNVEVHDDLHRPQLPYKQLINGFNCAPLQWLPVIKNTSSDQISHLRWGLIPSWAKDSNMAAKLINSRAETLNEKPSFKKAFAQQRCIIPANGFYEWKKGTVKQAFRFFLQEEEIFSMAGIWEQWKQNNGSILETFSIITTAANTLMAPMHHRMPLILSKSDEESWLHETSIDKLEGLLQPFPSQKMGFYPVSNRINFVSNDDANLVKEVADESKGLFG